MLASFPFNALKPPKQYRCSGIYIIRNLINQKSYVGSSVNLRDRFDNHRALLRKKTHRNVKLQRAFNKYGIDSFVFEVIEFCPEVGLLEREQAYIDELGIDTLYNIVAIAGRPPVFERTVKFRENMRRIKTGVTHTEEARRNMSIAQQNRRPLAPEVAQRVSEATRAAKTGTVHSEESKQKMSASHKGKKLSKETREKMSAYRRGRKMSNEAVENMKIGAQRRCARKRKEILDKHFNREILNDAINNCNSRNAILTYIGVSCCGSYLKILEEQASYYGLELPAKRRKNV